MPTGVIHTELDSFFMSILADTKLSDEQKAVINKLKNSLRNSTQLLAMVQGEGLHRQCGAMRCALLAAGVDLAAFTFWWGQGHITGG